MPIPDKIERYEVRCKVSKGTVPDGVRNSIKRVLRDLDYETVHILVEKAKKPRSLSQNAKWFSMLQNYVLPQFREYGDNWSQFSIHEYLMRELGYEKVLTGPKGEMFVSRMHSSEFSTKEFGEFMERAAAYLAAEHGVNLPLD